MNSLKLPYSKEVIRKVIHLSSLWIPVALYFLSKPSALVLLSTLLVILILFEIIRHQPKSVAYTLSQPFLPLLRPVELKKGVSSLTGATYVLIAAILSTLIFPTYIAITALSIMIIGDAAAALVGSRYGKIKIFHKSLEGSIAFFLTAMFTVGYIGFILNFSHAYFYAGFVTAGIATLVELFSQYFKVDDNLSITLVSGFSLWLMLGHS